MPNQAIVETAKEKDENWGVEGEFMNFIVAVFVTWGGGEEGVERKSAKY